MKKQHLVMLVLALTSAWLTPVAHARTRGDLRENKSFTDKTEGKNRRPVV